LADSVTFAGVKIALIHDAVLPVKKYGGTERVVWWLGKALALSGVDVSLVCSPGSECNWAKLVHPDFNRPLEPQLPGIDLLHYFNTPNETPTKPHVVTIGGNGKPGEAFLKNTVFVSRNHARRHGASCFVYNGVDPADYFYSEKKDGSLLFLAKAAWRVKNVGGAIRIARKAHRDLNILGGKRWFLNDWRGVHWRGMIGGQEKAEYLARSSALLFPVLWNEPFGLAVVEALVSGTPVFATRWGSLPELIGPGVGRVCENDSEFLYALACLDSFRSKDCRDWAVEKFSHLKMAEKYLLLYEKVLNGESLNASIPVTQEALDALQSIPFRAAGESSVEQPA
jgi:hypothetical protein